jgi:hypothetical protein
MRFCTVVLFVASFSSCKGCGGPESATSAGVGWTVDVPGFSLVEGRVFSTPAGQEDGFVPALAGRTVEWVRGCVTEASAPTAAGEPTKLRFVLRVGRDGQVAEASTPDTDQLASCIAARAKGQALSKPASIETWLQVGLRLMRQAPDGAAQLEARPPSRR